MSKGTLFGFIAAVCVVLGSILSATDKPLAFVDVPSMIIVIGGTFVALSFVRTGLALKAIRLMGKAFGRHKDSETSLKDEVGQIVRWAYIIQKNGLQGLETKLPTTSAPTIRFWPTVPIWSLPAIPALKSKPLWNI